MYELLIKNAIIADGYNCGVGDIAVEGGVIAARGTISAEAAKVIDASGKYLLPGAVDAHTHFDLQAGAFRTADDFRSGTRAAVCGGTTTIIDHVAFAPPGTLPHQQIKAYHQLADNNCYCDYAFHGLIQQADEPSLADMATLKERGIPSIKVYMTYEHALDDAALRRVLRQAAALGMLTVVHAEDDAQLTRLRDKFAAEGKTEPRWHAASRPAEVEADAIRRLLTIARECGDAPLYIAHLSTKAGLEAIRAARAAGQRHIYVESCPQYLLFSEDKYADATEGLKYLLTPPLRQLADNAALWQALADGSIDVIATDHCPFTLAQKAAGAADYRNAPCGIGGVEERMALMFSYGVADGLIDVNTLVNSCCRRPAQLFGLYPRKGSLMLGADADLLLINPAIKQTVDSKACHGNNDYNAYQGMALKCAINTVIKGGVIAYRGGEFRLRECGGHYLPRSL
ncbi:MAG: dihydropyrimidinase [Bacillota bacterium]|nr:dihydropyrimidinase [Bacillota bacterium]